MPKKDMALGADILAFYAAWPMGDDWCHESGEVEIVDPDTGDPALDPGNRYDLWDLGEIWWQGDARHAPERMVKEFASEFRKWLKARDTETIVLTVPKARAEDIRSFCREKGWL